MRDMISGEKRRRRRSCMMVPMNEQIVPAAPQAHGTLAQVALTNRRRLRLAAEIALFFIGLPLLAAWLIQTYRISLFLLLQPAFFALLSYLAWDRHFSGRREFSHWPDRRMLLSILALFAACAIAVSAVVAAMMPAAFLSLPRYNTGLWLLVMLFYPLLSALPQELGFRTFFFHRYGILFTGRPWLLIAVNGALFGFAHIIFGGWISVVLSGLLGALLAWRYLQGRSLGAVWIEHALYGQLVFTVGLGRYFYTGAANF
jgi:membrane protease YdiL (CAAX protease family)